MYSFLSELLKDIPNIWYLQNHFPQIYVGKYCQSNYPLMILLLHHYYIQNPLQSSIVFIWHCFNKYF